MIDITQPLKDCKLLEKYLHWLIDHPPFSLQVTVPDPDKEIKDWMEILSQSGQMLYRVGSTDQFESKVEGISFDNWKGLQKLGIKSLPPGHFDHFQMKRCVNCGKAMLVGQFCNCKNREIFTWET